MFASSPSVSQGERASVWCYPVSDTFLALVYLPQAQGLASYVPEERVRTLLHFYCLYSYLYYLLIMDSILVSHLYLGIKNDSS